MGKNRFRLIGKIVKAVGLKGDIKIYPLVRDFSIQIESGKLSFTDDGEKIIPGIMPIGKTGKLFRYSINGIDTRDDAEALIGKEVYVEVDHDEILPDDVVGFEVFTVSGMLIGKLTDVLPMPAHDVYVIERGENEVLIPAVDEFVKDVDLDNGKVVIFPMEGLF